MNLKRNIWLLYSISFFFALIPAYVIERLFWEMRGMSVLDVVLTEIIFGAVMLTLEVPAGLVADRIGKKPVIVLGIFLEGIMFVILLSADSFWQFAVAIAFSAAGGALLSGAENALLYDSLASIRQEHRFDWHLGRIQAVRIVSLMIAALSGSLLAEQYSFELNYLISILSISIAFIMSLFLSDRSVPEHEEPVSIMEQVRQSVEFFRQHPGLVYLLILGIMTGLAAGFTEEFWQLYLRDAGIELSFFGLFYGVVLLVQIPGGLLASRLRQRFGRENLLHFIVLTGALALVFSAFFVNWAGAAGLIVLLLASGMTEPLVLGALHEKADDRMRATLESFQSLAFNVVLVGVGTGFGYVSSAYSLTAGFALLGIMCLAPFIYKVMKKEPA
ncbi:MFS transporter [Jeotgalibacillus sp. R-1-5s-1]|uniref:MFS transporter n=1 Tax=Jeotgalibacillus sp. R-1-5s-1 TaxID=2555897 RepID=UPI00106D2DA2|nr:MFS transporter [Jeotgalibacillus sp. R-1-5s-1]TFE00797.1 MFS transporter [Jeotgalibacillus sp. R-1-5s-1]